METENRYGGTFPPSFAHFIALIRCLVLGRVYHRQSWPGHQQDVVGQERRPTCCSRREWWKTKDLRYRRHGRPTGVGVGGYAKDGRRVRWGVVRVDMAKEMVGPGLRLVGESVRGLFPTCLYFYVMVPVDNGRIAVQTTKSLSILRGQANVRRYFTLIPSVLR